MHRYNNFGPEMKDAIAKSRRLARQLEREGMTREARDLDRDTSFIAGWTAAHAQMAARVAS